MSKKEDKKMTKDELDQEAVKLLNSPIVLYGADLSKMIHYVHLVHKKTGEKAVSCVLQDGHVQWTPLKDGGPDAWQPANDGKVSEMYGQVQIYGADAEKASEAINARSKLSVYALSGFKDSAAEILNVDECVRTLANAIDQSNSFGTEKPSSSKKKASGLVPGGSQK